MSDSDVVGKTIDEIRELDPEVDDLSERELCYADTCDFSYYGSDIKKVITKAAAKCVLDGIELEVSKEQ